MVRVSPTGEPKRTIPKHERLISRVDGNAHPQKMVMPCAGGESNPRIMRLFVSESRGLERPKEACCDEWAHAFGLDVIVHVVVAIAFRSAFNN